MEVNRKWRCIHKGKIPFEFSLLMYMLPKGNIKFKQMQVGIVQESQASWKHPDSSGPSSGLAAADSLGNEGSGGIKPLIPTPSWGIHTSCRATCPSLSFHRGKENHRAPGAQVWGDTALGHRTREIHPLLGGGLPSHSFPVLRKSQERQLPAGCHP